MANRDFSLKHLVVLLYLLVLLLVIALLVNERRRESPPFTLSGSTVTMNQQESVLSFQGGDLSADLKGVVTSNLVNEKALLWQLLSGVSTRAVDITERLALVSCFGNKLVSIGISDQALPQFLGSLDLPAGIAGIKIIDGRALVAMERHAGIALIDVQNPSDLKLVAHFPLSGQITSMVADRNIVYYVDLFDGLGRLDLSAEKPVAEKLASLESPWRLALQGTRLVVATTKGKVHLFNLSDEGSPVEAGTFEFFLNVRDVAMTDEVLAVALADGSLHVFSLSSWPKLDAGTELKLPGRPLRLERIPGRNGIAASLVAGGVVLVDLSQPAAPRLAGHLKIANTLYDLKLEHGSVFGTTQSGLQVFSLDEIANGEDALLATEAVLGQAQNYLVAWHGHVYGYSKSDHVMELVDFGENATRGMGSTDRLLALAAADGINYFERSAAGQVRRSGRIDLGRNGVDAELRDGVLYALDRQGLQVFNAAQPEAPIKVSELPLPDITGYFAWLEGGYLLAAAVDGGLLVVDVQDPHRPAQVARLAFPRNSPKAISYENLLVAGQRVFVTQPDKGVNVVDVSDPQHPELLQIIETPGIAKGMALYDDLLLVADGDEGVFMVDLSDHKKVLVVGSWPVPLRVSKIAATSDGVIVSNYPGGTMKLPLPQRLRELRILSRGEGRAVLQEAAERQYVYLYDERNHAKAKVTVQ